MVGKNHFEQGQFKDTKYYKKLRDKADAAQPRARGLAWDERGTDSSEFEEPRGAHH